MPLDAAGLKTIRGTSASSSGALDEFCSLVMTAWTSRLSHTKGIPPCSPSAAEEGEKEADESGDLFCDLFTREPGSEDD